MQKHGCIHACPNVHPCMHACTHARANMAARSTAEARVGVESSLISGPPVAHADSATFPVGYRAGVRAFGRFVARSLGRSLEGWVGWWHGTRHVPCDARVSLFGCPGSVVRSSDWSIGSHSVGRRRACRAARRESTAIWAQNSDLDTEKQQ